MLTSNRVEFIGYPDAVSVGIILMPRINKFALFSYAGEGNMSFTGTHHDILVEGIEVIGMELLHSAHAIDLSMNLQKFRHHVMVVDTRLGIRSRR